MNTAAYQRLQLPESAVNLSTFHRMHIESQNHHHHHHHHHHHALGWLACSGCKCNSLQFVKRDCEWRQNPFLRSYDTIIKVAELVSPLYLWSFQISLVSVLTFFTAGTADIPCRNC
jgi:hypothetical protein